MSAAIYTTEPIYARDTWPGIPEITIRVDSLPPAEPVAFAMLTFYKAEEGPADPFITLTTPVGINITDEDAWEMTVPPQLLPDITPGEWSFRFQTRDAAVVWKTWFVGILTVL